MSPTIQIEGTLNADGTLVLDAKPNLPPGRVLVVVQPMPELPKDDPFWQMMQKIWADQKARGHVPRSKEEIDAQLAAMDDEWDERLQEFERIQREAREAREARRSQDHTE